MSHSEHDQAHTPADGADPSASRPDAPAGPGRIFAWLPDCGSRTLFAWALACVLLLGMLDYVTGWEISFSIFYLLPITMVVWPMGRRAGVAISVISALTWLTADLLWDHAHGLIPYWNALVRLGFFLTVTFALSSLRESRDRQAELTHFIVHDLRSPLTNVMAGLELVSSEGPGKMGAETQRELLEIAAVSGQQLMRLINSILDISRMECGQMPLQVRQVSVEDLADSALQQVALWAKQAGILTAVEIDPAARSAYADPSITARVLGNLLGNAMRYSPSQSTVTIRARRTSHGMISVSVADQGPGIPKEWVGKIFDKFAQMRARRSGAAVGSGLGLTFAKAAVEAQGGRIWIESEEGKGTTVTFTLPGARNARHA